MNMIMLSKITLKLRQTPLKYGIDLTYPCDLVPDAKLEFQEFYLTSEKMLRIGSSVMEGPWLSM